MNPDKQMNEIKLCNKQNKAGRLENINLKCILVRDLRNGKVLEHTKLPFFCTKDVGLALNVYTWQKAFPLWTFLFKTFHAGRWLFLQRKENQCVAFQFQLQSVVPVLLDVFSLVKTQPFISLLFPKLWSAQSNELGAFSSLQSVSHFSAEKKNLAGQIHNYVCINNCSVVRNGSQIITLRKAKADGKQPQASTFNVQNAAFLRGCGWTPVAAGRLEQQSCKINQLMRMEFSGW